MVVSVVAVVLREGMQINPCYGLELIVGVLVDKTMLWTGTDITGQLSRRKCVMMPVVGLCSSRKCLMMPFIWY